MTGKTMQKAILITAQEPRNNGARRGGMPRGTGVGMGFLQGEAGATAALWPLRSLKIPSRRHQVTQ
jgi:hypothetical protein